MKVLRLTAVLLVLAVGLSLLSGSMGAEKPEQLLVPAEETAATVPAAQETTLATQETILVTQEPTILTQPPTEAPTEPETQPSAEPETVQTQATEAATEPPSTQNVNIGPEIAGITAKKAFVYDCEARTYLYMKSEPTAKLYPASITKLVNVYTAVQFLDREAVVTVEADMLALVPIDASKIDLKEGKMLTVENLIKGVLVSSGSDAAHVLAVFAARVYYEDPEMPAQEAEDRYVELMNRQVERMGMINTFFVNCDGYPSYEHYTCMADLTILARRCLETPLIFDTVSNGYLRMYFTDGTSRRLASTNLLLRSSSDFYCREACGLKTGTSNDAGACLLSVFRVEERYIIVGVFGCPTFYSRYDNALKLFRSFRSYGDGA